MLAKLILASIVPGGFVVWGIYEYKRLKNRPKPTADSVIRDIQNAARIRKSNSNVRFNEDDV